jgi:predicted nucleic acid-binding protein
MLVVDASVVVASVSRADAFHDPSRRWMDSCIEDGVELFAPNLLEVELAAALRRLSGDRRFAERAVSRMHQKGFIELMPLTPERAWRAAELAARSGVRGADAVYLALAQELGVPLVTLDRQQLERGQDHVSVRRP